MTQIAIYFRFAWQACADVRFRILAGTLCGAGRVFGGLLFIWLSKQLIDIAVGDASGALLPLALLLVGTLVAEVACSVLQGYCEIRSEASLRNGLRQRLFDRAMWSCWTGRERFHTGDTVNRLEEDVRVVAEVLCRTLPSLLVAGAQALGAFGFLCSLNDSLAWVVVGVLPVFLLVGKRFTKHVRKLTADIRCTDGKVQSLVQESLQHRMLIASLQQCGGVMSRLAEVQRQLLDQVMGRARFTLLVRGIVLTGFGAGYLVAFLWGVTQLQQGLITFGVLTAFLQLVGQVQRPTADFSRQLPALIHASASAARLIELDTLPSEADDALPEGNDALSAGNDALPAGEATSVAGICLEGVTFAYPEGKRQIFANFTHDFRPGSSTAIMGETGTGKSTLVRLILAFLRPQQGKVCFYDKEGRQIPATAATRRHLAYVPQGNTLLSGTIRQNLLMGDPEATEDRMRDALHTAVADFVDTLPDGIDTLCGEQGAGLSEGQAQRIAIARALLRPGSILLLDEFSSALDRDTEQLLMERLTTRTAGKTLIFITHHWQIAERCEQIIRLSK